MALTGRPAYGEAEPGSGDAAIVGKPVFWRGRLMRIAIVAVPYRDRSTLAIQLRDPSFNSPRDLAVAASGPW